VDTPDFVGQIISFFHTATGWVTALAIPGTALVAGWHALMRATAQDEVAMMHHSRGLRNTVMYGGMAILAGAITTAILGQFHS
jgi:hypothetical protein